MKPSEFMKQEGYCKGTLLSWDTVTGLMNDFKYYSHDIPPSRGAELIVAERMKQIHKHGRTKAYDYNNNEEGQLQFAAHSLLAHELYEQAEVYDNLPRGWDEEHWCRMCNKSNKERLIIAGALIAAELDRVSFTEN